MEKVFGQRKSIALLVLALIALVLVLAWFQGRSSETYTEEKNQ